MKKAIVTLLTMVSMVTACSQVDTTSAASEQVRDITFNDVPQDYWGTEAIYKAVKTGYVDGYDDDTFRPDNNISRAEFIKMLVMATGGKTGTAGQHWYDPYLNAAAESGIYHSDDDFPVDQADALLTRAEMAKLAVRAVDKDSRPKAAHLYDMTAMTKAVNLGVIQGLSGGELGLNERTTRAQSVTIIERVLTTVRGGKLPVDKYALGNIELATKRTNIFTVIPEFFGGKQLDGYTWSPGNLVLETPDGKWKGELDQLVAIDLDDPNDPNLSLLPDINTLHFFNFNGPTKGPLVKDFPHSYILFYKSHVIDNKDATIYSDVVDFMPIEISGFKSPNYDDFNKGALNTLTSVFVNREGDLTAFIIPKSALTSGTIYLTIQAPAIAPNPDYHKKILGVGVDNSRVIH